MPSEQRNVAIPEVIQAGLEHHRAGRLPEAERAYQDVLTSEPDNPDALHLLGVIAHQVGRNEDSVGLISRAAGFSPSNPVYLNNLGEAYRALGKFEEALGSYDKALAVKPDYAEALSNRGLVLQQLKRHDEALAEYGRALALRPDYAEAINNRAATLIALKRFADALSSCDEAISLRPGYFEALSNRGVALHELKRYDEALVSYEKAAAIKPDSADIHYYRANALRDQKHLEPAFAGYSRVIALRPDHVEALNNRGVVLKELERYDEALADYATALRTNPDYANAHLNESICRLLTGDLERGWAKYEWRWKSEFGPSETRDFGRPLWLGDADLAGKTILLRAEQGLGDTIQFARYAQAVAQLGAKVILEVQPVLKALLSSIAGAHQVLAVGEPLPAFDFHCPLLSLPLAFKTRLETIPAAVPYLSADKAAVSAWRKKLAAKGTRLVGVCWKGSPEYRGDSERSMRLAELRPLLACPGLRFVSLQKELNEEERAITAGMENFVHPGADFRGTAELIGALDLVVSVDTAWAHWAGAIGKPVWVMLRSVPHWCWLLERKDSPWYPGARLFRQTRSGDWQNVVRSAKRELARFAERPPARRR
jgi:tetratricopeptide (TPR) repeat protein